MKRSAKLAVILTTSGAVIAGGALGAGAVFAADGDEPAAGARTRTETPWMGSDDCPGHGGKWGQAEGRGPGHMSGRAGAHGGQGMAGPMGGGITAESGKLTDAQKATLTALAEEEKVAYDLYTSFADRYDTPVFDRISRSEAHHLDIMRTLLDRYGIDDPTKGQKAGSFAGTEAQETYDRLLDQGKASQDDALKAGRTVEKADINDLTQALKGLDAPDAKQVYQRLLEASQKHLNAFEGQLGA